MIQSIRHKLIAAAMTGAMTGAMLALAAAAWVYGADPAARFGPARLELLTQLGLVFLALGVAERVFASLKAIYARRRIATAVQGAHKPD